MVEPAIRLWTPPQVAAAFGRHPETTSKFVRRWGIGSLHKQRFVYLSLQQVHNLVTAWKHPGYRGPLPWTEPRAPKARRWTIYTGTEVQAMLGISEEKLVDTVHRSPPIGQVIGRQRFYRPRDIEKLRFRLANPRMSIWPWTGEIQSPHPPPINLDRDIIAVYDAYIREIRSGSKKPDIVKIAEQVSASERGYE